MRLVARNHVFDFSDQLGFKLACSVAVSIETFHFTADNFQMPISLKGNNSGKIQSFNALGNLQFVPIISCRKGMSLAQDKYF